MGLLWSHQNKLNISSSFVFSGTSKVDTVNMIYKRRKDSCRYGTKAKQSFESNLLQYLNMASNAVESNLSVAQSLLLPSERITTDSAEYQQNIKTWTYQKQHQS